MKKIAILGSSRTIGLCKMTSESLIEFNDDIETVELTNADKLTDEYDGIICLSIYDLSDFEIMINDNYFSKCNMLITGSVLTDELFSVDKKKSDYCDSIIWRSKLKFKEALTEFLSLIYN